MNTTHKKVALIILDGWGLGELNEHNAIARARTPFFDSIWNAYPHTQLEASGEFVGLPSGQIGGSEVGHLTIGAGRVVFQDLPRITRALENSPLDLDVFSYLIQEAKTRTVHLIGLLSTGGIHSHQQHVFHILRIMKENGCKSPLIHIISDGRDTPPRSVRHNIAQLRQHMEELQFGSIATISGRFYAMDRDHNDDRVEQAVKTILAHDSHHMKSTQKNVYERINEMIDGAYKRDITDEFLPCTVVDPHYRGIKENDLLFFFNYRSDRMKQLVAMMNQMLPTVEIITMTQYDKNFTHKVIFHKQQVTNTLGEVLSRLGKIQMRAAETEKYAHVTYFFNGGVEVVFEGEHRSMSQSNRVRHHEAPHMKAEEIAQSVRAHVDEVRPDFILVNFANPDMVGHTGIFQAVVDGVEKVDHELKHLCEYLTNAGYICCITADHGNADIMYDVENDAPHTAHTMNPVPFIVYDPHNPSISKLKLSTDKNNGLQHIAATVLELMGLDPDATHEPSLIVSFAHKE